MSLVEYVYERRKLRVNGGKSKIMRCLRWQVILNGDPLEEVDCLTTGCRKWQLMEDVKGMWYTE